MWLLNFSAYHGLEARTFLNGSPFSTTGPLNPLHQAPFAGEKKGTSSQGLKMFQTVD